MTFQTDIFEIAAYDGINYWAEDIEISNDTRPFLSFRVSDAYSDVFDKPLAFVISEDDIDRGIRTALKASFKISPNHRADISRGFKTKSAEHIDSIAADVIVQAAVFDRIIFG